MAPKNPFRASLSDRAKKKLDVIVAHEEEKVGLDADGNQIKLTPQQIIENLIDVRHELVAGGVTNRQRMIGLEEASRAQTEALKEQNEAINKQTAAIDALSSKLDTVIDLLRGNKNVQETRSVYRLPARVSKRSGGRGTKRDDRPTGAESAPEA